MMTPHSLWKYLIVALILTISLSSCTVTKQLDSTPNLHPAPVLAQATSTLVPLTPSSVNPSVISTTNKLGAQLGELIFAAHSSDKGYEIFLLPAQCIHKDLGCSSNWTRLTQTPKSKFPSGGEPTDIRNLAVSPNGKYLAFAYQPSDGSERANWDIYTLNIDECLALPEGCGPERFTRLTTTAGDDDMPAWSPDGKKIVFVSSRRSPNPKALYIMNSDGTAQTPLIYDTDSSYLFPAWSPDGRSLVFGVMLARTQHVMPTLYRATADGSQLATLTDLPSNTEHGDEWPRWSPDSKYLIFSSYRLGNSEIFRMNFDGKGLTQLTNMKDNAFRPAWSPDGKTIIFLAPGKPESDGSVLWAIDSDGKNLVQLTDISSGYIDAAIWSP
jgi:Tol biopolymer transport system component